MMGEVRTWAAAICLTVLASALLRMLCPEGNFSRLLRVILGAFVLCAVLKPVQNLWGMSWEQGEYQDAMAQAEAYEEQTEGAYTAVVEESVRSLIAAELTENGFSFTKIRVETDTGEDERIIMKQIQVTLTNGQDAEKARLLLQESLGLETEVTADENR